jgi:serine/threonine protein kinase, bacterial
MRLETGTVFAGYTILRLLGSGAMGEVYLATHPRLPRPDALKILPERVSVDAEFRGRFNREADLAAKLYHPHIVGVHDRGEFDGQLWISMDYVDGADAAQVVRTQYPDGMPPAEVCEIVTAIAEALDYAHQRGMLHRDVKPANILLTEPEDDHRRILLADFGVARQYEDHDGLTATGIAVGTVKYAAPEQLMGADIDGRADQYALAATAFYLLSGSAPFRSSNPVAIISQHLNGVLPKLSDRRPELTRLDQVLSTALAKEPDDRFVRCRDFAKALSKQAAMESGMDDRAEADLSTVSAPIVGSETQIVVPPAAPPAGREHRRRRSRILLAVATMVIALAAVGVVGYISQKHGTAPAAILDGTYRVVYDNAKQTTNGAPWTQSRPNSDNTTWWAFRSRCTPNRGCTATGTGLDSKNPKATRAPDVRMTSHFADGHWRSTPARDQQNEPECLSVDEKIVAAAESQVIMWSLEPQVDGSLRGAVTVTTLTNECGIGGRVVQTPVVVTRTGDVPAGVVVADPAEVSESAPTSTPPPPPGGPVLDGAYRLDFDSAGATFNGQRVHVDLPLATHYWAFRSSCTTTRCVATGAKLVDTNPQVPDGGSTVLEFSNGRWQDTPTLQTAVPCDNQNKTAGERSTHSWSFQPQPDGTLRGVGTDTVLTNECGDQGNVYTIPFTATRIGDVPPGAVLADPALF